jgi:hypothetical protein
MMTSMNQTSRGFFEAFQIDDASLTRQGNRVRIPDRAHLGLLRLSVYKGRKGAPLL